MQEKFPPEVYKYLPSHELSIHDFIAFKLPFDVTEIISRHMPFQKYLSVVHNQQSQNFNSPSSKYVRCATMLKISLLKGSGKFGFRASATGCVTGDKPPISATSTFLVTWDGQTNQIGTVPLV